MTGLKEYIGANPALLQQYSTTAVRSHGSNPSMTGSDFAELQDEFYDAIAAEPVSSDDESDDDKGSDEVSFFNLCINYNKIFNRIGYYMCLRGLKQRKLTSSVMLYNLILTQFVRSTKSN